MILNMQSLVFFSMELKNEFEIAVVNKPSVFEQLKFYCNDEEFCNYHHCNINIEQFYFSMQQGV